MALAAPLIRGYQTNRVGGTSLNVREPPIVARRVIGLSDQARGWAFPAFSSSLRTVRAAKAG
jgi:hypothetical protein